MRPSDTLDRQARLSAEDAAFYAKQRYPYTAKSAARVAVVLRLMAQVEARREDEEHEHAHAAGWRAGRAFAEAEAMHPHKAVCFACRRSAPARYADGVGDPRWRLRPGRVYGCAGFACSYCRFSTGFRPVLRSY